MSSNFASQIDSKLKGVDCGCAQLHHVAHGSNRTDPSSSSASSHIIAVISQNLTGAKAEELLGMLTHNSTETRIGNDVIMPSTAALYLLHLPKDVLAYVPLQGIENSPLGQGPSTAPWWVNLVVGVANFIWNGIVSVARFILDLGVGDVVGKCVRYYVDLCAPDPLINHAYVVGYFERCCCHMPAVEVRDSARASVCIIGCGGFGSLSSDSGFCSSSIMMSTNET